MHPSLTGGIFALDTVLTIVFILDIILNHYKKPDKCESDSPVEGSVLFCSGLINKSLIKYTKRFGHPYNSDRAYYCFNFMIKFIKNV